MNNRISYKKGDRVMHTNHGAGTVTTDSVDVWETEVEFDVEPEGWDKTITVSNSCLRPAE